MKKDERKDEEAYSLKTIYKKSSLGIAQEVITDMWKKNRILIYVDIVLTSILCSTLSGYLYLLTEGQGYSHTLLNAVIFGVIKIPWLTAIFFIVINRYTYRFFSALHKESVIDADRNYTASREGNKGTAHKMTLEEKNEVFTCGDYSTQLDNIIGCEPGDKQKLYALRQGFGINNNVLITGAPGCGKSVGIAIPTIMQTIRRGESLVITDPKGELYRDTAAIAKAHGYVVKILNFRPTQSLHTDTCDYMSVIGQSSFKSQSFSKTVIDNTSDGKPADFWTESEFNLFMGLCIWVNNNNMSIEKTMGSIYDFMRDHTVDEFEDICYALDDDHPAIPYLKTFVNGDKTVKGNTYAGLQIRLSALADPFVQKIVGTPDIDFTLPGRQKCIYYISSPDTDKSRSYLVALFFTLLYNELIDYADKQESGHLPIRVTMLLDEFKNIGVIPAFPEKLSTVRSRWIDTIIILQGIEQLQSMYPDNEWETIVNDCDTVMLLKANNKINCEYFSFLSGEQTTEERSIRYEESAGDVFKIHPSYTVTQATGNRNVYTPNEIRTLKKNHLLVWIAHSQVTELEKIAYFEHPMCKEIRKWVPQFHAPKWVLELNKEDREKFHVYNDIFKRELIDDIELCTEDDFREPWNKTKEQELQEYIAYYAKYRKKPPKKKTHLHAAQSAGSAYENITVTNKQENHEAPTDELQIKNTIASLGKSNNINNRPKLQKDKKDYVPEKNTEKKGDSIVPVSEDETSITPTKTNSPSTRQVEEKFSQAHVKIANENLTSPINSPSGAIQLNESNVEKRTKTENKNFNFIEEPSFKFSALAKLNKTEDDNTQWKKLETETDIKTNNSISNNKRGMEFVSDANSINMEYCNEEFDPVAGFMDQTPYTTEITEDLEIDLEKIDVPDFSERETFS